MIKTTHRPQLARWGWRGAALAALLVGSAGAVRAQVGVQSDDPTAHSVLPVPEEPKPSSALCRVGQAICWYLPNRIMDVFDIVRVHAAVGDGMGGTLRVTKYIWASSFHDNAWCIGWAGKPRQYPMYGEQVEERYFQFFAAKEGELDRDPTEVGLSFHFMIAGANVAASLGKLADAITGIVGIDLANDDHGPVMFDQTKPEEPLAPAPSAAAPADAGPAQAAPTPAESQTPPSEPAAD
jgi:hypothetical protein